MDQFPLLKDIAIIFGLSIGVLLLCSRFHIPTIVGFLITGVLCGPHSLGLISELSDVQILANVGIILLLFIVGMEFSLGRLIHYKRFFFAGGILQVLLTGAGAFALAQALGRPIGESLFLGCLVALSSTAIVMRALEERGESMTAQGKVALSVLIFQDLLVVPMVLFTPILAGEEANINVHFLVAIAKGLLTLFLVFILAELVVPKLLFFIAKTRSRELFLLGVLTICTSVIWVTSLFGVSLSLGAFLAGLIISESDYCQEAIGDVIPFQNLFTSFFFVSMGMLIDLKFLYEHLPLVGLGSLGIIFLKSTVMTLVTVILGMPLRIAILAGLALAQVGEFSFVLVRVGIAYGIASDFHHQLFLAVSLLTMGLTPFMMAIAPKIADWALLIPWLRLKQGFRPIYERKEKHLKDHLIIIGFGFIGGSLARAAEEEQISYLIIDMQPEKVRLEKKKGTPIHFGDAAHDSVLKHAYINSAKVVSVSINDISSTIRIIKAVRRLNPHVHLIVRAVTLAQVKLFYRLGASEVIADELGATIEMYAHVLQRYRIKSSEIAKFASQTRLESYEVVKFLYTEPSIIQELISRYPTIDTETVKIQSDSIIAGQQIKEIDLLRKLKLTIIVILRGDHKIVYPSNEEVLEPEDLIVLMGKSNAILKATNLFYPEKV